MLLRLAARLRRAVHAGVRLSPVVLLLLASSGAEVRAETPAARLLALADQAGEEGATCRADALERRAARRAASMARIRAQLRAQLARDAEQVDGEPVRALNGRGYGYHARPSILQALHRIEVEAAIQRR